MLKIEIKTTDTETRSGVSNRTGQSYSIREQMAYLHAPQEAYPVKFKISLRDNQPPHAPGMYHLDDKTLRVGRYGQLEVGTLVLVPAKAA